MPKPGTTGTSRWPGTWVLVAAALTLLALLHLADHALWSRLTLPREQFTRWEARDGYRLLRILGYWPTWLAIGGVMIASALTLQARRRDPGVHGTIGLMLILSSGLAGALAELAKLTIRRERPGIDGLYRFDWPATGAPLGTISSHAAVAFGAAFLLARAVPGSGWIAIPLACGCGLTRILSGAHFTTDVFGAAILGYAVAAVCARALPRRPD